MTSFWLTIFPAELIRPFKASNDVNLLLSPAIHRQLTGIFYLTKPNFSKWNLFQRKLSNYREISPRVCRVFSSIEARGQKYARDKHWIQFQALQTSCSNIHITLNTKANISTNAQDTKSLCKCSKIIHSNNIDDISYASSIINLNWYKRTILDDWNCERLIASSFRFLGWLTMIERVVECGYNSSQRVRRDMEATTNHFIYKGACRNLAHCLIAWWVFTLSIPCSTYAVLLYVPIGLSSLKISICPLSLWALNLCMYAGMSLKACVFLVIMSWIPSHFCLDRWNKDFLSLLQSIVISDSKWQSTNPVLLRCRKKKITTSHNANFLN